MIEAAVMRAFTDNGKGGNRAGVVFAPVPEARMQPLAAHLGFSETVFVMPSHRADYRLRYFTPTDEVPLCGHATIAAFASLHTPGSFLIETGVGRLSVRVDGDGLVMMEQGRPEFFDVLPPEAVSDCLDPALIDPELPIQIVSAGLRDILLPVRSVEALYRLQPELTQLKELSRRLGVVGLHAFALSRGCTAECRNFAPLYGIDEESATGTSNGALACYLYRQGIRKSRYLFLQGRNMGSPSRILAEFRGEASVLVGGYAALETMCSVSKAEIQP